MIIFGLGTGNEQAASTNIEKKSKNRKGRDAVASQMQRKQDETALLRKGKPHD